MLLKISYLSAIILVVLFIATDTEAICLEGPSTKHAPAALHINRSNTIPANTKTRLTFYNAILDIANLTNTGKTFIGYSIQSLDPSYITGGVLCNRLYKVYGIRFNINPDVHGTSGNTVDGVGSCLEMSVIYYRIEYGSFEKALKHKDGIVVVSYAVKVVKIPSLGFIPLELVLSTGLVNHPNSHIYIPGLFIYLWFDDILLSHKYKYFAYAGSFFDPETELSIPVATIIFIDPDQAWYISEFQYSKLQAIKGLNGKSLNSALPTVPQGNTKVYLGEFINMFVTPD